MTIRMSPSSSLVVEARAWADELEGLLFDGAPVAEVGLIRRLADALVEAEKVRRLHEVATQRTVELAAVIEKAKAEVTKWPARDALNGLIAAHATLASVDTAAVLAERDAEKWDEGYEAAANFHEGREKGHWEDDSPRKGMRTWRPDPAPVNPYR